MIKFEMDVKALRLVTRLNEAGTGTKQVTVAELQGNGAIFDVDAEGLRLGQRVRVSIESLPGAAKRSIIESATAQVIAEVNASKSKTVRSRRE